MRLAQTQTYLYQTIKLIKSICHVACTRVPGTFTTARDRFLLSRDRVQHSTKQQRNKQGRRVTRVCRVGPQCLALLGISYLLNRTLFQDEAASKEEDLIHQPSSASSSVNASAADAETPVWRPTISGTCCCCCCCCKQGGELSTRNKTAFHKDIILRLIKMTMMIDDDDADSTLSPSPPNRTVLSWRAAAAEILIKTIINGLKDVLT